MKYKEKDTIKNNTNYPLIDNLSASLSYYA